MSKTVNILSDGTVENTHIVIAGKDISNICSKVSFVFEAGDIARTELTLFGDISFEAELDLADVDIVGQEY